MANNTKYIPSGQWTYLGYRDKDWSHVIPNKNIRSGTWITIRQEFNGVIALYRQQMMCTHDFAHFTVTLFDQLFMARKKTVNPKNWVTILVRIGGSHHVNISGDTTHLVARIYLYVNSIFVKPPGLFSFKPNFCCVTNTSI